MGSDLTIPAVQQQGDGRKVKRFAPHFSVAIPSGAMYPSGLSEAEVG